jgi:hypothetical protein
MRRTVSASAIGGAEAMRCVPYVDVQRMRRAVPLAERAYDAAVLLARMQGRFTSRPRAACASSKARPKAPHIRRATQQARISRRLRLAQVGVRARWLCMHVMRCAWSAPTGRPHQAVLDASRPSARCRQRPDTVRTVSPQDADLWLARLLAQAQAVEIAAKRLAQGVLSFEGSL